MTKAHISRRKSRPRVPSSQRSSAQAAGNSRATLFTGPRSNPAPPCKHGALMSYSSISHPINSTSWREEYHSKYWDACDGSSQTAHFMDRLLEGLAPAEFEFLKQGDSGSSRSKLGTGPARNFWSFMRRRDTCPGDVPIELPTGSEPSGMRSMRRSNRLAMSRQSTNLAGVGVRLRDQILLVRDNPRTKLVLVGSAVNPRYQRRRTPRITGPARNENRTFTLESAGGPRSNHSSQSRVKGSSTIWTTSGSTPSGPTATCRGRSGT